MPRSKEGYLWTPSETTEGLTTDAVVKSTPRIRDSYDVIVIGAGFAGLVAARELAKRSDLDVLLVDARDRIGGRTWVSRALGEEFEMGGTWVHWSQPHTYSELHRYGLHHDLKTSSGTYACEQAFFRDRGATSTSSLDPAKTDQILTAVADKFFTVDGMSSKELMPYPHDPLRVPEAPWRAYDHLSVNDRLDQINLSKYERNLWEAHFNSLGCGTGDNTAFTEALRWYALSGHSFVGLYDSLGMFKIGKGGTTSLARHILADYDGSLALETVVEEIAQDKTGVTVRTKAGSKLRARYVVCTIPLNCLTDISFSPPFTPLRHEAVRLGHMNKGAKIHFWLEQSLPGWFSNTPSPEGGDFLFAFSDHNGNTSSSEDGNYCIGFGFNDKLTDRSDHKRIVSEFKKLRPDAEVRGYLTHDWMNDPYAKGTWYCCGPGTTTKFLQEMQKPHGRVVMASADWASGWRGFIDGAIEQGTRAAMYTREQLGLFPLTKANL